ncbi:hypothetical protein D3C85_1225820 [compost metagenome]
MVASILPTLLHIIVIGHILQFLLGRAKAPQHLLHLGFVARFRFLTLFIAGELGRAKRRVGADQIKAVGLERLGCKRVVGIENLGLGRPLQRHIDPGQHHHTWRGIGTGKRGIAQGLFEVLFLGIAHSPQVVNHAFDMAEGH